MHAHREITVETGGRGTDVNDFAAVQEITAARVRVSRSPLKLSWVVVTELLCRSPGFITLSASWEGGQTRRGAAPIMCSFQKKSLLICALKGYNLLEKHARDKQPHRPSFKRDFSRFMVPLCTDASF